MYRKIEQRVTEMGSLESFVLELGAGMGFPGEMRELRGPFI